MSTKRLAPSGLADHILAILQWHIGAGAAIQRPSLLDRSRERGKCDDTDMRLAIQELRERGELICNMKNGDGYFIARSVEEYEYFREEYNTPAITIHRVISAMDKTARKRFNYHPGQSRMF